MNILTYKPETTGFPDWSGRSGAENQPHLVRLSAVLFDSKTQSPITMIDKVIRPEGWDIPQAAIDSHGVTNELAHKIGISELDAIEQFMILLAQADQVITSNKRFNSRIMRIALTRHSTKDIVEEWKNFESHCVMEMAKGDLGNKKITLPDVLLHYIGDKSINNNDSLFVAESTAKVFFAINSKN